MTEICSARATLDFDSVDCRLLAGHNGLHECQGDGPAIKWIEGHVGSTPRSARAEAWQEGYEAHQRVTFDGEESPDNPYAGASDLPCKYYACEHGSAATDGDVRVCLTCGDVAIDLNSRDSLLADVQQWNETLSHAMPATESLVARLARFVRQSVPDAPGRNGG